MLPGQEFSDYINASYVDVITTDVHRKGPEYIGVGRDEVGVLTPTDVHNYRVLHCTLPVLPD